MRRHYFLFFFLLVARHPVLSQSCRSSAGAPDMEPLFSLTCPLPPVLQGAPQFTAGLLQPPFICPTL